MRKALRVGALLVSVAGIVVVPASQAFGLTAFYGTTPTPSPIPTSTPGGFSTVTQVTPISPSSSTQNVTTTIDGVQANISILPGTFTTNESVVFTSPSNSTLDSQLPSLGLGGYITVGGVAITIENSNGTAFSGNFAQPITLTITGSSINPSDKVVEFLPNGTSVTLSNVTFGTGSVTFSFDSDPAFAVLAPTVSTTGASGAVATLNTPDGKGYWLVASDGGVFSFGDATYYGSMGGKKLNAPVVGMVSTPDGKGYGLVASDGGVFSFGDATYYDSMGGKAIPGPVVGMVSTSDGQGYWLVDSAGNLYSFGDAGSYGSMAGKQLSKPIVGMVRTPDGKGYWLVASDGGVFSFGDATYYGSMGGKKLNAPVNGIAASPTGQGYWLFASDGGVFTFGNAGFFGSMGGKTLNAPVVQ